MTGAPTGTKSLRRLTKRSQFVRTARGNRAGRPSLALQSVAVDDEAPGVGYTVTKQCGNAPERNRIKRRLRAAAGACAGTFRAQHDYVLLGRRDALQTPFEELVGDLGQLIERVHSPKASSSKSSRHQADGPRNQRP